MMPQKHNSKSPDGINHLNTGLTLMEVILSVGLFGVLVVVAAKLKSDQFAAQEHLKVRGEVEDVRDLIRSSIDCEKSLQNQTQLCDTNQYITIRKSDSSVLIGIPEPNTGFGLPNEDMVEVRAKCTHGDGFDTIEMEYRRTRNGEVIRDKLNKREYNWKNLFHAVPITCPVFPSAPDYVQCAKLPTRGYAGVGKCGSNQVMVIINDGKSNGRTCCPIGTNVLSSNPQEINQIRSSICLADEVSTGIVNMTTPYCTKINTNYFKLQDAGPSRHSYSSTSPVLAPIAAIYKNGDCCACPEGSVMVGGHSLGNGNCVDKCVFIIKK